MQTVPQVSSAHLSFCTFSHHSPPLPEPQLGLYTVPPCFCFCFFFNHSSHSLAPSALHRGCLPCLECKSLNTSCLALSVHLPLNHHFRRKALPDPHRPDQTCQLHNCHPLFLLTRYLIMCNNVFNAYFFSESLSFVRV